MTCSTKFEIFSYRLWSAVKMKINKGFSLVELMIVLAIIAVMSTVASYAWMRYARNTDLKTASRDIVSDFQNCKAKAISESRNYQISFTAGTGGSYTISAPATTSHAAASTTKLSEAFGSGIQIVFESGCNGYGAAPTNVIRFETRGTSKSGCVKLTNSRGSSASITTNFTGKTYVTFAMQ